MKPKINLGFDIGVASVGWAILDENNNILRMGSRLFDDAANNKDGSYASAERRGFRSNRRRLLREKNRKKDLINLFIDQGWINNFDEFQNLLNSYYKGREQEHILNLKVRCLNGEKVNNFEIMRILYHYIQHRGYFYKNIEDESENIVNNSTDLPSIQLLKLEKEIGFYKDTKESQSFSHQDWLKEVNKILENINLNETEFSKKYLDIFNRVRNFADGPGNEKTPTPYGRFYERNENGEFPLTLWEKTIGKCSIYPNEYRGGKSSPISELFNLLNDLNNLKIENSDNPELDKLSSNDKIELLQIMFNEVVNKNKSKNVNNKLIGKTFGFDEKFIKGYRIDKNQKPLYTELKSYNAIVKFIKENNLVNNLEFLNYTDESLLDLANDIYEICRKYYTDFNTLKDKVSNNYKIINPESFDLFKKLKFSDSHSLSYKAMKEYIFKVGINENINQSAYFYTKELANIEKQNRFGNSKYIPTNLFENEIISPTAKRALLQNIKVLNKIIKLYSKEYDIQNITIEMARDKNTAEERKRITEAQRNNEQQLNKICDLYNIDKDNLNSKTITKLKLWFQQESLDIYDGQKIDIDDLLKDSGAYEIDHIIPFSISGEDSLSNKVLTKKINNQNKGNKTPWQYLNSIGKFDSYHKRIEDLYSRNLINTKKFENLISSKDIRLDDVINFIGKNLSDTRYATRLVLNILQDFFDKKKDIYPYVKIKTIAGGMTNYARKNLFHIKKDRENFEHHAVDAAIIAFLGQDFVINKTLSSYYKYSKHQEVDVELDLSKFGAKNKDKDIQVFADELRHRIENKEISFSRPINTKNNISFADQTIYSISYNDDGTINTYKKLKLLRASNVDLEKYFGEKADQKDLNKLEVYSSNKNLYDELRKIYLHYSKLDSKANPFISYMKEINSNLSNNSIEPKYIQVGSYKVKKLKILDASNKNPLEVKILNYQDKKAALSSLDWTEIRIYKNNSGKFVLVTMNINFFKSTKNKEINKLEIDIPKLNDYLKEQKIENNERFIKLQRGSILRNINDNNLFYISGCTFANKRIEIKSLDTTNELKGLRKQNQIGISTIIENYSLLELDELGNIYSEIKLSDIIK